jgi:tRNA-dihydrouridine synthase C
MIGRGVIRSPWLFDQIRRQLRGETVIAPTGREVMEYVLALWGSQSGADRPEKTRCERLKKFLNYLGEGVPGTFWQQIRRTETAADFHRICRECLDHDDPMPMVPIQREAPSADRSETLAMQAAR